MLQLTFKQTQAEMMVRAASTILFNALSKTCLTVKLSELAESPQYGLTTSATNEPIGPKFVRITDLKDGDINWQTVPFCRCEDAHKYALETDDILFARTGATTGKTHLVQEAQNAVFASYLIRLRPKKEVSANYLYSFFQSDLYWSQILEEKKGSAQPNVNGKKLVTIRLPIVEAGIQHAVSNFLEVVRRRQDGSLESLPELPFPIAEQRRIVARIEELAAKIEEARGLREGAIEESDALEKALLDEVYQFSLKTFGSSKLSEICLTITDGDHLTPSFQDAGVKFIFVGNVSSGSLHFQGCKYVAPEYYATIKSHRKPEKGDVLYSAVGATLGIPAIVDSDEDFCFQRHIALLKPDRSQLIPKFLWHMLRSRSLYQAVWKGTTGSAQPTVPLRSIRSLQVPKPPLNEQKRMVVQLDELQSKADEIKQLREDALKEFDALLPAILDKAFKGEL